MKKVFLFSAFILSLLFAFNAYAVGNPVEMLQQTANQMLQTLRQDNARVKSDPNYLYQIVERQLLPKADLEKMSALVVGHYWRDANATQKQRFEDLFTRYVTQTYSAALESYTNEKVIFYPIRGGYQNRSDVEVQSVIKRNGGSDISVSYKLHLVNGNWRIYDFSVEGVSMVRSYQAQFAGVLSQGGMEKLLSELQRRQGR